MSRGDAHCETKTCNKRGDEAIAADALGECKSQDRHRQRRQPLKRLLHPAAIRHALNQRATYPANGKSDNRAECYLLDHESKPCAFVISRLRTE